MKLPKIKLDRLDLRILSLLLSDGRITKSQIAEQVGLSLTPCCERIKKLEAAGVIQGYRAELDLQALVPVSYFRVQITFLDTDLEYFRQFEALVATIPQIIECEAILGDIDYLLLFAVTSTEQYQQILEALLTNIEGNVDYRTYPVSKSVKAQTVEKSRWLLDAWSEQA